MQRRQFLIESGRTALGSSLLSLTGCSTAPKDVFLESLVADWERGIPQWLQETKMPGVSIALIRDGTLAWQRGFGVKDAGTSEPVDNETVFAACSDTKPVFAYAVMKLCEKGLLNLETPLTKYTSKRIMADPRLDLITARHVLNHTTGFPNWRNGKELKIEFTPGEKYQYSGEGFMYLQSVVEQITGQPFEDFMRTNILVPFGMTSSRFGFDVANPPELAKPHDKDGKRIAGKYYTPPTPAEKAEGLAGYGAAAMLMTTPSDYAKFLLEIVNPKPADAFRLNEANRQEMLRPRGKRGEQGNVEQWGSLGWSIIQMKDGPTFFTHAGEDAGYYCVAAGSVERKAGLMVMMNGDNYEAFQGEVDAELVGFREALFYLVREHEMLALSRGTIAGVRITGLTLLLAACGWAQPVMVYSEFARIAANGDVTAPANPREILSPAVARNGFTSFQIVVKVPDGSPWQLYVAQNPENAVRVTLYRENGDRLEPVTQPARGENTQVFWMDVWPDKGAPVQRIKVEPQLNIKNDWVIYPMEVRVMAATVPDGIWPAGTTVPGEVMRGFLCGSPQAPTAAAPGVPAETNLTIPGLRFRNAQQDRALAPKAARADLQARFGACETQPPADDPEWYFRVRDLLYRLP